MSAMESSRKSMDKRSEKEGEEMVDAMSSSGMLLLNGNMKGDENGECTFIGGRGESVIDYTWVVDTAIKEIKDFRVEMIGGSDHLPMVTEVKGKSLARRTRRRRETREIEVWSDEAIAKFRQSCEDLKWEGNDINEKMDDLIRKVSGCIVKKVIKVKERGQYDWWNKDCEKKSRDLKRCLRKRKKKKASREEVLGARKELEEAKDRAKEEQARLWEENISLVKNENDMWNMIAKERKKKEGISDKITEEDWRSHFMNLFEGEEIEELGDQGTGERVRGLIEITDEEIEFQVKKLKKKKAAGEDGLKNEVWTYGTENVKSRLADIIKEIGRGGVFPERWKKGVISPIYKKGGMDEAKNYRGVTLMDTGYKIYAGILNERLKREIEGKNLLYEGQAGFRKGRGTMDNIYILKRVVDDEVHGKGNQVYACFVDLKAAFDKVNRENCGRI